VAFKSWATAIRLSSCVNFSNLRKASSISDLPINFFQNFSKENKLKEAAYQENRLTHFSLFNLLGQEGKDVQYVNHDIHYNFGHFFRRWEFDIDLESDEESFEIFE
jgi:hypothetical protein